MIAIELLVVGLACYMTGALPVTRGNPFQTHPLRWSYPSALTYALDDRSRLDRSDSQRPSQTNVHTTSCPMRLRYGIASWTRTGAPGLDRFFLF